MNKQRALFYLGRRISELECLSAPPDSVGMAERGVALDMRHAAIQAAALEADYHRPELEALREVVALVMGSP